MGFVWASRLSLSALRSTDVRLPGDDGSSRAQLRWRSTRKSKWWEEELLGKNKIPLMRLLTLLQRVLAEEGLGSLCFDKNKFKSLVKLWGESV